MSFYLFISLINVIFNFVMPTELDWWLASWGQLYSRHVPRATERCNLSLVFRHPVKCFLAYRQPSHYCLHVYIFSPRTA